MKPERTLQRMYNEFPKLFPVRQQALNHLFCVVGNGYSWYKGEIVSDDELFIWDNKIERYIIDPDYEMDEEPDIISTPPKTEEEYREPDNRTKKFFKRYGLGEPSPVKKIYYVRVFHGGRCVDLSGMVHRL